MINNLQEIIVLMALLVGVGILEDYTNKTIVKLKL